MLNLSSNQLTTLPDSITQLQGLQTLSLGGNQLTAVPDSITQLAGLRELRLMNNRLQEVPDSITQLSGLKELDLDGNGLTEVPKSIAKLQSLELLDVRNNKLTELPDSVTQLEGLQALFLSDNQLVEIPDSITRLDGLKVLDLSNNQMTALPESIAKLQSLELLAVRNNELTEIPESITQLEKLQHLDLDGNPLKDPPIEIAERGIEAIRDYFASRKGEVLRPLNEVKVLFVGDGGAGKTSLVKRLLGEEFDPDENQTYGINIDAWPIKPDGTPVTAHLWDFGGQVIMHATHQFFLSRRSLYVLLLDGRKEEDPEYWLKHIESFGGGSPVLVVLNKMDEHPSFDVNRKFYQEKYPGIVGFYPISCERKRGSGIPAFKQALFDSLSTVEMLKTEWPESWFRVKEEIEAMDDPFMGIEAYNDCCEEAEIADESSRNTLVQFLHDLGRVVHFPDFELQETHVLDPKWLTTAVYAIINSDLLAKNKGLLNLSSLRSILGKVEGYPYPKSKHRFIVDLMKKFELCFTVDDGRVLIPDLLEVPEPDFGFDADAALRFRLQYDFLPSSIIPRFIVRRHRDIKDELRWRTGVVLEAEGFESTAVVRADVAEKRIEIEISGGDRRDYLAVIRSTFHDINGSFEKLDVTEEVPLPDNPSIAVSFEHLRKLEARGDEAFLPEGSDDDYKVRDLLGVVYVEKRLNEKAIRDFVRHIADENDTEATLLKKLERNVQLNPGMFGVHFDIKGFARDFVSDPIAKRKVKRKTKAKAKVRARKKAKAKPRKKG